MEIQGDMEMDKSAVITLYNEHERISLSPTGYEKIHSDSVIKLISPEQSGSFISYYRLDLDDQLVQKAIDLEVRYFESLGKSFEWKVYSSDLPSDMGVLLSRSGFLAEERESFMVLDLESLTLAEDTGICSRITTEAGIQDVITVQEDIWGKDLTHLRDALSRQLQIEPENVSMYCVYDEGRPVSSAWITFSPNSPFAGLWGGSTLAAYRGRGFYKQLLNRRAAEAIARGYRYLTIDASDMSRPIVEKRGFQLISTTTPYVYNP
ncbi:MAG: GNAT family N-acetyltransferase [Endozoicomonas sp.]|uniref:GNAT family N-acetyltransferase n=1 Tax=Endozoicomonas sp. TaxID=1892382 RepID=UPI003D9B3E5F